MQFNEEVFTRAFTAALKQATQNPAYKQTSTATGSTMNLIHGPGSLFGQVAVGIEPDVISAMLMWQGIADHLPIRGVRTREVLLPFITGVDRTSSTEPTNECADCIAGETESCIQHFPMGRVCRETQTMTPDHREAKPGGH
jgi:hypothetical protein